MDELHAQRGAHRRDRAGRRRLRRRSPDRFIKQNSVTDPSLLPIYELIGCLPNLPVGYAKRNDPTPVEQTFGLSQRSRLQDASNDLYQQALERLMRPRLILSLEQQIQKNIDDPTFVYEALKVYLMLGGKAPQVDKDLILAWFTRDWEERAFPGAPNAQGRALLRAASRGHARHGRRASEEGFAQRPAGRAGAGDARAHARRRARLHAPEVRGAQRRRSRTGSPRSTAGPDMALVFEAANGANLDTVRVPGFFTYDGFYDRAARPYADDRRQAAEGELGARRVRRPERRQAAVRQPLPRHSRALRPDFIAAWTAAINNLQLKPLLNDKPKYLKLSAASAPTSPIRLIFESIRDETALTRERPKPPAQSDAAAR